MLREDWWVQGEIWSTCTLFRMPFTNVLKGSQKRICPLCPKLQKGWGEDLKGSDLFSGLEFTSYPEGSSISVES